jgi:hypothetical protein
VGTSRRPQGIVLRLAQPAGGRCRDRQDDARGEFQDDTENDLAWARFDSSLGTTGQSHTVVAY